MYQEVTQNCNDKDKSYTGTWYCATIEVGCCTSNNVFLLILLRSCHLAFVSPLLANRASIKFKQSQMISFTVIPLLLQICESFINKERECVKTRGCATEEECVSSTSTGYYDGNTVQVKKNGGKSSFTWQ